MEALRRGEIRKMQKWTKDAGNNNNGNNQNNKSDNRLGGMESSGKVLTGSYT